MPTQAIRYGQSVVGYNAAGAPHPFTVDLTDFTRDAAFQVARDTDEGGAIRAFLLNARVVNLQWEGKVKAGSSDFIDLSTGASVAVSGYTTGGVLASKAVQTWRPYPAAGTLALTATWFPDLTTPLGGAAAGVTLDTVTPSQSGLSLIRPGANGIYGTYGITHTAGEVQMLELTQERTNTPDDVSPDGTIKGVLSDEYVRTINLELKATGTRPVEGTALTLSGLNTDNYMITGVNEGRRFRKAVMWRIAAIWAECLAS